MKREHEIKLISTDKASNLAIDNKYVDDNGMIFLKSKCDKDLNYQFLLVLSHQEINENSEHKYFLGLDNKVYLWNGTKGTYNVIIDSNSEKLTPNHLLNDNYIETFAKAFNNGKAPETIWLEIEEVLADNMANIKCPTFTIEILKTSNNYVIVAEQDYKYWDANISEKDKGIIKEKYNKYLAEQEERVKCKFCGGLTRCWAECGRPENMEETYTKKEVDQLMNEMLCEVLLKPTTSTILLRVKKLPNSNNIAEYIIEFLNQHYKQTT